MQEGLSVQQQKPNEALWAFDASKMSGFGHVIDGRMCCRYYMSRLGNTSVSQQEEEVTAASDTWT